MVSANLYLFQTRNIRSKWHDTLLQFSQGLQCLKMKQFLAKLGSPAAHKILIRNHYLIKRRSNLHFESHECPQSLKETSILKTSMSHHHYYVHGNFLQGYRWVQNSVYLHINSHSTTTFCLPLTIVATNSPCFLFHRQYVKQFWI